jgi:DNA-binding transcriptional ArsR family regulator
MVRLLLQRPLHVQALSDALGVTQPAVSRHAKVLCEAGVVEIVRSGRRAYLRCPPHDAGREIRQLLFLIADFDVRPAMSDVPATERPRPGAAPASPRAGDIEDYLL